jgi:hypothetical protein
MAGMETAPAILVGMIVMALKVRMTLIRVDQRQAAGVKMSSGKVDCSHALNELEYTATFSIQKDSRAEG